VFSSGSCDLLLNPIHDPEHRQWAYPKKGYWSDFYEQYLSPGWTGGEDSYWIRPWCRIEATFAAVTPLASEEESWRRKAKALEGRPLGSMMASGRRPHLLFGTKELEELRTPIFLPPMLHAQLEKYAANKVLGNLTSQEDRGVIEGYVEEARRCQPKLGVGVVHLEGGRVRQPFADGTVYEGECKEGKKEGRGKMMYSDGDVYEGELKEDKFEGRGKFMYSDGSVYKGEWKEDKMEGRGKFMFSDGHVYEGEFKEDKMEGRGKMMYSSGDVYEGEFKEGKFEGRGKMMYSNGEVYEGEFKEGKRVA
jgi:hypothetical protein